MIFDSGLPYLTIMSAKLMPERMPSRSGIWPRKAKPPLSSPPFFFQAEDGIRDFHVTGVQTCALPIYRAAPPEDRRLGEGDRRDQVRRRPLPPAHGVRQAPPLAARPRPRRARRYHACAGAAGGVQIGRAHV